MQAHSACGNRSNVGLLLALDYLVDVPRALFTERRRSSQDHKAARRWGAGRSGVLGDLAEPRERRAAQAAFLSPTSATLFRGDIRCLCPPLESNSAYDMTPASFTHTTFLSTRATRTRFGF